MTTKEFNEIVYNRLDKIHKLLVKKADEYATEDRLYNFKAGAGFTDTTPEETLWGYLTKHLVSVRDIVNGTRPHTKEMVDEKIGDVIAYFILLEALLIENQNFKLG